MVCYDEDREDAAALLMTKVKMWCMTIRIKKNDTRDGKRLYNVLLDFMMRAGICGATVINGVDGFGRRGKSTLRIEGISINIH